MRKVLEGNPCPECGFDHGGCAMQGEVNEESAEQSMHVVRKPRIPNRRGLRVLRQERSEE